MHKQEAREKLLMYRFITLITIEHYDLKVQLWL